MLVERLRHSENGAIHPASWERIRALEDKAHQVYVDFVRESGEVAGRNYRACILMHAELEADLQSYIADWSQECFVETVTPEYGGQRTTVYDMTTGNGVEREVYPDREPDYYELESWQWGRKGRRLLSEIFEPGKYPELAELAVVKRPQLVEPDELPARIMTAEEYKRAMAAAKLSRFAVNHLVHILQLYHQVAYPDSTYEPQDEQRVGKWYKDLQAGESLGLRTGTKYLDCAKHQLDVTDYNDLLQTWMYLNYEIPIGPVKLHFREDITMAVEFGDQARSYFIEEGIAVERQ